MSHTTLVDLHGQLEAALSAHAWAECLTYVHSAIVEADRAAARIASLEAALASYDAGKSDREKLADERIASLEAAVAARDQLRSTNDVLAKSISLAAARIAEFEQSTKTLSAGIDHLAGQLEKAEEERDKLTKELAFLKPLTVKPDDTDSYLVERKAYRELENSIRASRTLVWAAKLPL